MKFKAIVKAEFETVYDDTEVLCARTTGIIDFIKQVNGTFDEHWSLRKVEAREVYVKEVE